MEKDGNERKLKLIWDFKGPDAAKIAEHHSLHLKQYVENNNIPLNNTGFEQISEGHYIAYLVVHESGMKIVRDALKPHRGQIYPE